MHPSLTVVSGAVTLQAEASAIHLGLPYNADIRTMRLEAGSADGVGQGKTKRINLAVYRLYQAGGAFKYGLALDDLNQHEFRTADDDISEAVPLFSGDSPRLHPPGGYEKEGSLAFRHDLPLPCTLLAMFPQLSTQDGG